MAQAGVAELKANLSAYLKRVKAGEEIVVTERGKVIARLIPFMANGPLPEDEDERAEYEQQVRAGVLRPPKQALPRDFWERPRASDPEGSVLMALLEEREKNR